MAAALFLACGMVAQYRAQRAAAAVSAPRGAGGGPVELLTFEMLHDPHCKADKHCHSACRMVCDEVNSGQGAREHAATLISFGCCLSAPVITKPAGSPVPLAPRGAASPLQLLSVRQPAKEQMLFEVNAKGHIRFDRPADTRKDSIAVHVLRDRHSLAADLRDLEREQAALTKRVSKLRIQDVLPFRVAAGQSLVRRGSKHPGKLYPEGPGSTDPYYDEEDKLPDTWEEPECDLPAILKGKVKCTIGNKRKITGTDPNGVERQAEMKGKHEAKWKGHVCEGAGCPEEDSSWQEYDKFRAYLQAADQETEAAPSTSYHITSIAPAPKCNEVCMPFYLSVKELCTHTARKAASLASKMVKLSLSLSLSLSRLLSRSLFWFLSVPPPYIALEPAISWI